MKTKYLALTAIMASLCAAACSTQHGSQISNPSSPQAANDVAKRATPIVSGRPARVYIWAGFDEKTCTAITAEITVAKPPSKGSLSFKPNQPTTIKQSSSGKCIGHRLPGTGVYYTARKGQTGTDSFSITATTQDGQTATRSFEVLIVN